MVQKVYRSHSHLKWVKNKGALLVLIWSFLVLIVYNYLSGTYNILFPRNLLRYSNTILGAITLFYPLAGWLADVRLGRYRMIHISCWIMWAGTVMLMANKTAVAYTGAQDWIGESYVTVPLFIIIAIGFGGVQANIIQFGIDQLSDASSKEITSYIRWYVLTFISSKLFVRFVYDCTCSKYQLVSTLLVPICLSLAVCLDSLFNKILVKEPKAINPLKTTFKVIKYAIKNKYPRNRSAFTYWEDVRLSRIELAKNKYGGPFTTEQVEDVKTFLRILVIILSVSLFVGISVNMETGSNLMVFHLRNDNYQKACNESESVTLYLQNCFEKITVKYSGYLVVIFLIPLYELFLYPAILSKYSLDCGILRKFTLGMAFMMLSVLGQLLLEAFGHYILLKNDTHNGTLKCFLKDKDYMPSQALSIDYRWLTITNFFDGSAQYLLLLSAIEFICAQCPYSVKGLLYGVIYGTCGLSTLFAYLLLFLPFQLTVDNWSGKPVTVYGCGFWFFLVYTVAIMISFIVFFFLVRQWYKKRRRDENLHNEQIFAVNYYDQYIAADNAANKMNT